MLNRKSNIIIFLAMAVIAISICIQVSLANFNRDIGYQQPIKAVEYEHTATGWYITFLNISANVQKDQLVQVVQPVTTAINNIPMEEIQQYQYIALDKITTWWQQVITSNPVETVRCLTNNIISKVDSK